MKSAPLKFRTDIELLRGVAVILVLLFHLKITAFPSGFIGVDIFFVISGYLIAATLKGTRKSDILDFFDRRIRRIIPLAFFVFITTLLISPFFFLPFEVKQIAQSFIATTALVPNISYWMDENYFEKQNFRPMLHYWSLGVEYHYYLLFPLLMVLTKYIRFLPHLAFAISLTMCVYLTTLSPKTAFFLLPTRFWEFLLGYYAFALYSKNKLPGTIRTGISLTCIAALAAFSMMNIPVGEFPGLYALPIATATALFMVCGFNLKGKVLPTILKPLSLSGRWSYSIYLVHFPVIFILGYQPFDYDYQLSTNQKIIAIFLTYGLSFLTYSLIENPLRGRQKYTGKIFYRGLAAYLVFSIAAISLFYTQNFFVKTHDPAIAKISSAMEDRSTYRCGKIKRLTQYEHASCSLHEATSDSLSALLIGNSHADAIKETLKTAAAENTVSFYMMKQNCTLSESGCGIGTLKKEIENRRITALILHATKDGYDPEKLEALFSLAKEQNTKVHVIAPTPHYKSSVPAQLYKEHFEEQIDQSFRQNRNNYRTEFADYLQIARKNKHRHVTFHDVQDILCPETCVLSSNDSLFYYDNHHLTLTGANLLQPIADRIFGSISNKRNEH